MERFSGSCKNQHAVGIIIAETDPRKQQAS
jgi:hypothetical protein